MYEILDIATMVIIVTMITVLVWPGSNGPQFVNDISNGFADLVKAVVS